jgi:hypothetical protein
MQSPVAFVQEKSPTGMKETFACVQSLAFLN